MKKQNLIYLTVLSVALMACSEKNATSPNQSASAVTASAAADSGLPVYRVVKDNAYPPYVMFAKGEHIGYEVDILNAVAKNQGFRVEYVYEPWDKLFDDLNQKNIVISLGGTSIEDVNQEISTPTIPYMVSLDCVASLSSDDLEQWKNKTFVATTDGGMADVLTADYRINKDKITETHTHYLILSTLAKKEAQIGVGDCASLRYNAASPTFKDYPIKVKELPKSVEDDSTRLVFSVRKDQTELLNKINAGLKAIEQSGELAAIKRKWGQQ